MPPSDLSRDGQFAFSAEVANAGIVEGLIVRRRAHGRQGGLLDPINVHVLRLPATVGGRSRTPVAYASAAFAFSARTANASCSCTARSASTRRSTSIDARLRPATNRL